MFMFPQIKTHGCVLVAKKDIWHTSVHVLFTGKAKLPFLTPLISYSYWADLYQVYIF